jgi:hypothetical protein
MSKGNYVALAAGAVAGLPFGIFLVALGWLVEFAHPTTSYLSLLTDMPLILIVGLTVGLFLPIGACVGALVGLLFVRVFNGLAVLKPFLGTSMYGKAIVFAVMLWWLYLIAWMARFHSIRVGDWISQLGMFAFEGVVFVSLFGRWTKAPSR